MTIEILTNTQRLLLLAAVPVFAVAAFILRRREQRGSLIVAATVIAAISAGALVAEQLVSLIIDVAAPPMSDFNQYRWVIMAPWGTLGLVFGVSVVAAIVVLSWRGTAMIVSPWRRSILISLRCGAAAAALVLFLEPAIELRQVAREPNRIAILIDDSRSMSLKDDKDGPSRRERARRIIERSKSTFKGWRDKHHLDFFTFSDVLVPSSEKSARKKVKTDGGPGTMIRLALEQTRTRYEGTDLAGIVLLSDGIPTGGFASLLSGSSGGAGAGASRSFLRELDTKVHTLWVGRKGLRDIALARVLADEFAFVRTVVKVEAVIRATGYKRRRIPVTLSSDGVALRQKWATVGPGETKTRVVFEFSPPRVGKYVYQISTPVESDEAVSTNNSRSFVIRVIRDKIRVLQVAGRPSWDVRALRRMLKKNPNVDLISFFILRTHDDVTLVPNHEMSLIPFPTRELFRQQLPSFDLIVLQNFEYRPYAIGRYLENIRRYVHDGGGLAMLGGSLSFASGRYGGTPVGEALPVHLPRGLRSSRELLDTEMFTPKLTKHGLLHPITALRYATKDNKATWKTLPKLEGVNIVGRAKPNATVLATHPRLKTSGRGRRPLPVIVAGEYGKGRSLAVTTDSLWRWAFMPTDKTGSTGRRHYNKFWENAIRWLIHDPDLRYLHVDSNAVEYAPGTAVRLNIRLLNRDYTPRAGGEVKLKIRRGSDPKKAKKVSDAKVVVGDTGEGTHELDGLDPGVYWVEATAKLDGRPVKAKDIFLVREGSLELDRPGADSAALETVASTTGGKYLGKADELPSGLAFEQPRIVRIDRRADVELWSRSALLFLALAFLGLEWLLRQRTGYL